MCSSPSLASDPLSEERVIERPTATDLYSNYRFVGIGGVDFLMWFSGCIFIGL